MDDVFGDRTMVSEEGMEILNGGIDGKIANVDGATLDTRSRSPKRGRLCVYGTSKPIEIERKRIESWPSSWDSEGRSLGGSTCQR